MTQLKKINIPNIGDFDSVEVIEVMVKVGDEIKEEDSLICTYRFRRGHDVWRLPAARFYPVSTAPGLGQV